MTRTVSVLGRNKKYICDLDLGNPSNAVGKKKIFFGHIRHLLS